MKYMKKFFFIILTVVLMSCCLCFSSSALTVNSTYSDVASTSTQANNLINYAMSFDSFVHSDYVVFCDQQYSYYIVWSDELVVNGSTVTGSDVEYIRYYRSGSTGNYTYTYLYGTDSSFSLRSTFLCTSNLADFGFQSSLYDEYRFRADVLLFFVLLASFGFVKMIISLRGNKH